MDEHEMAFGIEQVVERIVALAQPERIILFNRKLDLSGETSSFKLCVVSDRAGRDELEKRIYLTIDSDLPFDVLTYTPEQWASQSTEHGSFAQKIQKTGKVLYEK